MHVGDNSNEIRHVDSSKEYFLIREHFMGFHYKYNQKQQACYT